MSNQVLGNGIDYSPVIMKGSPTGYYVVIFGGATQTGKNTRGDALVSRSERDFVYGPKGKMRPEGVIKEGDNERPDSIHLSPQRYAGLKRAGHVLVDAEYSHGQTRYVPLRSFPERGYSAVPDGHHVIFVSLTHEGAMRTREALIEYNPLTFLMYTRLETLRKRLDFSRMSDSEKVRRLQQYANDFAQFRVRTDDYLFLLHVKSPNIADDLYRDESARQRAKAEIQRDADSIVDLISRFQNVFQPPMSYLEIHQSFVEKLVRALFGTSLDNLGRMLQSSKDVKLDVGEQAQNYLDSGNYLSNEELNYLSELRPLGLIAANGRHTLLLRGFGDPLHHNVNGHTPLEDILLKFIVEKSKEKPTVVESIKGQIPNTESNLGLVKTVSDASLKDGLTYSLGNTHLVDNTHPSLSIVFVYPQREDVDLRRAVVGMDSLEVKNLEDRTIQ